MPPTLDAPLPIHQRHRARRMACVNGLTWALGSGLLSTTLVTYLLKEIGCAGEGLAVALVLAMRYVVGVLRLAVPWTIGRWVDRKVFCVGMFAASACVLSLLPALAAPGVLPTPLGSVVAVVALWCVYHVLEYLADVALYSWLGDIAAARVRGRFFGRRQRWMLAGALTATVAVGMGQLAWRAVLPGAPRWPLYCVLAAVGAVVLGLAVWPLTLMPHAATRAVVRQGATWSALLRPLADRRFRQLLLFGGWLALFSGFVQSAQQLYVMHALGISLAVSLAARTGMQAGQWATSPRAGRMVDRWGHRPVLAASLLLASAGPMCYFIATPETWWWFFGAWVMWIAYVGLNVTLPSLMLRLSPADADTPYIAVYYTLTGLCYAASTIAGGAWLDAARDETYALAGIEITAFQAMFLVAWLGRSAGVVWLIGLREKPRRGSVA